MSDDSDSDVDMPEMSVEDQGEIMRLDAELKENPNVYDSHAQLIGLLKKCGLKGRLQSAREELRSRFPLSEDLWRDWLNDEIGNVAGDEDVEMIEALFEVAVADYLSIPIWGDYLQFLTALDTEVSEHSDAGASKMRGVCERALTACGMHFTQGAEIWKACRSYELAVLEGAAGGGGSGGAAGKQAERVRSLFRRQLAVPHAGHEATLAEYVAWERALPGNASFEGPDATLASNYAKAVKMADARAANEAAVAEGKAATAELLSAYMAYVRYEEASSKDPARVQCVFERAVALFPSTAEVWVQYGKYVGRALGGVPAAAQGVLARAARNCPWVGALHTSAIRAMELAGSPDADIHAAYERSLAGGMQSPEEYLEVVLARADSLRRAAERGQPGAAEALRGVFSHGGTLIAEYFPDFREPTLSLPTYWADCELRVGGGADAARDVWEGVVKSQGWNVDAWGRYIQMERAQRNVEEARALYRRCHGKKFEGGGQERVLRAWLKFEREEGSAEDYHEAAARLEPMIAELAAARAAAAAAEEGAPAKAHPAPEEARRMRQERDPNFKAAGGRGAPAGGRGAGAAEPPKRKRGLGYTEEPDANKRPRKDPAPAPAPAVEGAEGKAEGKAAPQHNDVLTLFVANLPFEADEGALEGLFKGKEGFKEVRLVRDRSSKRSKGFAYVEFATAADVEKALALEGQEFMGRPLRVSKSAPTKGPGASSAGAGDGGGRGGRGRGRGGRGEGGRGHGGAGLGAGRGPKGQVQLVGSNTTFVPRNVQKPGAGGAAKPGSSNADFRALLLGGKK